MRAAGRRAGQRGRKPGRVRGQLAGRVRRRRRHRRKQRSGRRGGPVRRADLRSQAADRQGRQPRRRGPDPRDGQRGDRPGQRRPWAAARARDLFPRDRRSDERPGHIAGVQRRARGWLRSARGDPRAVRPPSAGREQRQPRGGRREVVRPRAGRLDDGVHRDRRGHRDGDHHRRRARPWAPTVPRARSAICRWSAIRSTPATGCTEGSRTRSARPESSRRSTSAASPEDPELVLGRTTCSSSPTPATRQRGRWSITSPRAWARRSRTVCAILDPELVVLGGGIGASPLLLRPVRGVGGRAGSDHRADRDQPAGRAGRAAGSDRGRAACRAHDLLIPGRCRRPQRNPVARGRPRVSGRCSRDERAGRIGKELFDLSVLASKAYRPIYSFCLGIFPNDRVD